MLILLSLIFWLSTKQPYFLRNKGNEENSLKNTAFPHNEYNKSYRPNGSEFGGKFNNERTNDDSPNTFKSNLTIIQMMKKMKVNQFINQVI